MNILLDECVPARLGRLLGPHSVTTVSRNGWAGIKNGALLALAEKEFDVFIPVDRRIPSEQRLEKFDIAGVLIRARSNRLAEISPLVAEIVAALSQAAAGKVTTVGS